MLFDIALHRTQHVGKVHIGIGTQTGAIVAVHQFHHRFTLLDQGGDGAAERLSVDGGNDVGICIQLPALLELLRLHLRIFIATGFIDTEANALAGGLFIQAPGYAPPVAVFAMGQQGTDSPGLLGTFTLAWLVKPKPLFITGGIAAACLSFSVYIYANWTPAPTHDLLGLGHLCSLPGAAIGLLIGAVISRLTQQSSTAAFVTGISGFGLGFAVNQAVLCSTVMSCRALLPFL